MCCVRFSYIDMLHLWHPKKVCNYYLVEPVVIVGKNILELVGKVIVSFACMFVVVVMSRCFVVFPRQCAGLSEKIQMRPPVVPPILYSECRTYRQLICCPLPCLLLSNPSQRANGLLQHFFGCHRLRKPISILTRR